MGDNWERVKLWWVCLRIFLRIKLFVLLKFYYFVDLRLFKLK